MAKNKRTQQLSDLKPLARHFERVFTAPFTQRYSDAPTFQQRYSDAPIAALLVNRQKSRRRRQNQIEGGGR